METMTATMRINGPKLGRLLFTVPCHSTGIQPPHSSLQYTSISHLVAESVPLISFSTIYFHSDFHLLATRSQPQIRCPHDLTTTDYVRLIIQAIVRTTIPATQRFSQGRILRIPELGALAIGMTTTCTMPPDEGTGTVQRSTGANSPSDITSTYSALKDQPS
ncbi:hypothetical protein BS47DRAFT_123377 [Hydnum rufescens UP504]|uniref:Uncharacterized protein n=1 Tax=Hydnum rufescens UP504 TaxID=1448309 RepID=A0A9P6E1C9_9AGAM|nr:hypothetical protein BS47DRAFT_123377 [Hydnum rufescens UP504]